MLVAMALLITGCSSISTDADFDTQTDFNRYQTWAWVESSEAVGEQQYHVDGLTDRRIRNAINRELTARGLTQVDAAQADMLVNYLTQTEKKVNVDTFYSSFGYHPYYYGRYPFHTGIHADTRVREYQEGTLVVDLIDRQSKSLFWRGSGTDTVKEYKNPQQRTDQVNEVVNLILQQYPPQ
ncbi:DUF4136 domain-containing protein [Ferrimonas pelagia]|uniref:DUF4136 domain-containing protein n=2 Tax=Ferrimonas pelagia TaxID=1177826 RepID=A0ABP9E7A7_9GAMM